jgi:hypothetical protein
MIEICRKYSLGDNPSSSAIHKLLSDNYPNYHVYCISHLDVEVVGGAKLRDIGLRKVLRKVFGEVMLIDAVPIAESQSFLSLVEVLDASSVKIGMWFSAFACFFLAPRPILVSQFEPTDKQVTVAFSSLILVNPDLVEIRMLGFPGEATDCVFVARHA